MSITIIIRTTVIIIIVSLLSSSSSSSSLVLFLFIFDPRHILSLPRNIVKKIRKCKGIGLHDLQSVQSVAGKLSRNAAPKLKSTDTENSYISINQSINQSKFL